MNGFDADSSYVDFGAPNYSRTKTNDEVTIEFFKDFFWSNQMQAVAMNGIANGYAVGSLPYTIFDSGTSQIVLPPSIFY
jgi:hypothetical protein